MKLAPTLSVEERYKIVIPDAMRTMDGENSVAVRIGNHGAHDVRKKRGMGAVRPARRHVQMGAHTMDPGH